MRSTTGVADTTTTVVLRQTKSAEAAPPQKPPGLVARNGISWIVFERQNGEVLGGQAVWCYFVDRLLPRKRCDPRNHTKFTKLPEHTQ